MSQSFRKSLLCVIFDILENQMTLKLLNTNHKRLLFMEFYKLWLFFLLSYWKGIKYSILDYYRIGIEKEKKNTRTRQ